MKQMAQKKVWVIAPSKNHHNFTLEELLAKEAARKKPDIEIPALLRNQAE